MAKVLPIRPGRDDLEKRTVKIEKRIRYKQTFDYTLIVTVVLLVAIGLVMVFSSSYYVAEINGESQFHYFFKQLLCVGLGTLFMLLFMFFDYHYFLELPWREKPWLTLFKKIKPYWAALLLGLITLALVFVPGIGVDINGSKRWINVGISIQPSEIMKMGVIIFMACSIGRNPRRMRYFSYGVLPYIVILALACVIIYMQPNFSAIVCLAGLVLCILYVGGAKISHLLLIISVAAAALIVLVVRKSYRTDRLDALFDPLSNWQLRQSLYSIGAGGLFGRGLGNSMQKLLYLPYRESDFIFAIIAEEMGYIFCVFMIALFAILIWRGIVAALHAPDLTGMLLASGSVAMIAIQVIVNIGVNVGLLPPTGVVLPFISYGGSGIIIFMSIVGMTLNVSRQGMLTVPAKKTGEVSQADAQKEPGKVIGRDRAAGIEGLQRRREKMEQKRHNYIPQEKSSRPLLRK